MLQDQWIRGWKNIARFVGGYKTKAAVLTLSTKYGLPLRTLPSGESILIVSEANEWLRTFTEESSPFRLRNLAGAALVAFSGGDAGAYRGGKMGNQRAAIDMLPKGQIDFFAGVPHDNLGG